MSLPAFVSEWEKEQAERIRAALEYHDRNEPFIVWSSLRSKVEHKRWTLEREAILASSYSRHSYRIGRRGQDVVPPTLFNAIIGVVGDIWKGNRREPGV